MAGTSAIEWTDATWNPIVGCSIKSPGCAHCYAMPMAARIEAINQALVAEGKPPASPQYEGTTRKVNGNVVWTGKLAMAPDHILLAPLKRKMPTKYFVNSMGDLFHEDCPDEWIDKVFAVMALAPQHTFQVLTKRAKRMREYMSRPTNPRRFAEQAEIEGRNLFGSHPGLRTTNWSYGKERMPECHWPLRNAWLGVSIERQQEADERIPELLRTPAAVRFISAEPLLGPIDLEGWRAPDCDIDGLTTNAYAASAAATRIDWVIAGGESGSKARPSHPDWVRSLREQCAASEVQFFFKQWGEFGDYVDAINVSRKHALCGAMGSPPTLENNWSKALQFMKSTQELDGAGVVCRVGKKAAGRLLDGIEHNEFPRARAQ